MTACAVDANTGLVWSCEESWIRVRSQTTGEVKLQHHFRNGSKYATAICTTGGNAWIGHRDGSISILALTNAVPVAELVLHEGAITTIAVTPQAVMTTGADGRLAMWEPLELRCTACVKLSEQPLVSSCLSGNDLLFVGSAEGQLHAISVSSQQHLSPPVRIMQGAIRSMAVVGSHRDQLWIGGEDGRVGIVDVSSPSSSSFSCCRFVQTGHDSPVSHMLYCSGDRRLWTASRGSGIVIYDVATTNIAQTIPLGSPGHGTSFVSLSAGSNRKGTSAGEFVTAISLVTHGYAWRVWACGSDGTIKAWLTTDPAEAPASSAAVVAGNHVETAAKLRLLESDLASARHEIVILTGKLQSNGLNRAVEPNEELTNVRLENITLRERLEAATTEAAPQAFRTEISNLRQRIFEEQASNRKCIDDLKRADAEIAMLRTQLAESVGLGRSVPTDLRGHTGILSNSLNPLRGIYQNYVADDVIGTMEESSRRRLQYIETTFREQFRWIMSEFADKLTVREKYERQLVQDISQLRAAISGEDRLGHALRQAESERNRSNDKAEELSREVSTLAASLQKARQQLEIAREDEASLSGTIRQLEQERRQWTLREAELAQELQRESTFAQGLRESLTEARDRNAALESEIKARAVMVADREEMAAQAARARDGVAEKLAEAEEKIHTMELEVLRLKSSSTSSAEENRSLHVQIDGLRSHYEGLLKQQQSLCAEAQNESNELGQALRAANRQALENKQHAEDRSGEADMLRQRLDQSQQTVRQLKADYDALAKSKSESDAHFGAELESLSRQTADAKREARLTAEQFEAYQRQAQADYRDAAEKADEILRTEIKARSEAMTSLEQQHNAALSRLHAAQEECRRAVMASTEAKLDAERSREQLEHMNKLSSSEREALQVQIDLVQEQTKRSERQAQQLVREASEHVEMLVADASKLRAELAAKTNALQDAIRDKERAEAESRRQTALVQNQAALMDAEVATLQRQVQEGSFLGERTILQAEVTDLRQQVHALQRELQVRRGEIRDLERSADDRNAENTLKLRQEQNAVLGLRSEVEKLTATIKIKMNTIATLEQHVADIEQTSKSTISDMKQQHDAALERLKNENAALQKEVRRLEGEFAQCARTLETFQHEVKVSHRNERSEFESQLEEYKAQVQSLQKELRTRTIDLTTAIKQQDELISDAQSQLRKEKQNLLTSNDELSQRVAALESELRTRSHDWNEQKLSLLEKADDLAGKLRAEKHKAEAAVQEGEHRQSQLEKELRLRLAELAALQSALDESSLEKQKQRSRQPHLQNSRELDALRERLTKAERDLEARTSDVAVLQRIIDEKDVEHQMRWRDDRTTYEAQITQHREDLKACRDVMKLKEREVEDLRQQLIRAKAEHGRVLNEKGMLEGELETQRLQLARFQEKQKLQAANNAATEDIQARVLSLQRELAQASEMCSEKDVELKKLRSQVSTNEALIDELRQQFRQAQERSRRDAEEAEQRLEEAMRDNASLRREVFTAQAETSSKRQPPAVPQSSKTTTHQALTELSRRDEDMRTQMSSILAGRSASGGGGRSASGGDMFESASTRQASAVSSHPQFVDVTGSDRPYGSVLTPRRASASTNYSTGGSSREATPQLAAETAASLLFSSTGLPVQSQIQTSGPVNLGALPSAAPYGTVFHTTRHHNPSSLRHLHYSNTPVPIPEQSTSTTTRTTRHF